MTNHRLRLVWLVGGLLVTLSGCATSQPVIERFEASIRLAAEGVADITESLTVRSGGEAPGSFERVVAPSRAERVEFVSATIDGEPVAPDAVLIDAGTTRVLRVTWRLDPLSGVRRLGLRYRASGVLGVSGRQGRFEWAAIPAAHQDSIADVRLEVSAAEGTRRVGDWGIAEAGWQVAALPNGISAVRAAARPGAGGTIVAEVAVDPGEMAEPRWQHDQDLGRQLVPAFISGGLFILTVGVGVIWIIWFERSSRSRTPGGSVADTRPESRRTAEGLYTAGLVCLAFGAVVTVATYVMLGRYGTWSMSIPASIVIVGALFVLAGKRPARSGRRQPKTDD